MSNSRDVDYALNQIAQEPQARECKNCAFFVHAMKNGRKYRHRFGECTYVVIWPEIPMNYSRPSDYRTKVWHNSNAESCKCYKEKPK